MAFIGCIVKIPFNLGCPDVLGMLKLLGVLLSEESDCTFVSSRFGSEVICLETDS